ncbi:MAG: tRNA dihydrouridine synthase DusB [Spirochaetia bacterium]|nr:tRNA dihydrouridine synthase DusB [Spirochaetia bacterium]
MPAGSSSSNPERSGPLLGGQRLTTPFLLAPVAGYSDAAFRSVCFELGASLCYTEMVSAEALTRNNKKTEFLLGREESEAYYAIQLFGSKPAGRAGAAAAAAARAPLLIDLNCGCPVPKIVRTGSGSALLKNPALIRDSVAAMAKASGLPITVKLRLGWDEGSINYQDTAAAALEGGAAAITLHGRTRAQGYGGKADWAAIGALAGALKGSGVPVFGSGDAFSAPAALSMLKETGCAGVMIARGAMGNPFIFAEAAALFRDEPLPVFSNADIAAAARRHLERSVRFLGEKTACVEFRKQFCAYTKGRQGGARLREQAVHCSAHAEFNAVLDEFAVAG